MIPVRCSHCETPIGHRPYFTSPPQYIFCDNCAETVDERELAAREFNR